MPPTSKRQNAEAIREMLQTAEYLPLSADGRHRHMANRSARSGGRFTAGGIPRRRWVFALTIHVAIEAPADHGSLAGDLRIVAGRVIAPLSTQRGASGVARFAGRLARRPAAGEAVPRILHRGGAPACQGFACSRPCTGASSRGQRMPRTFTRSCSRRSSRASSCWTGTAT